METGLPLDTGAADPVAKLAPTSSGASAPAALPERAVPTIPKGKRPAIKREAGQQGRKADASNSIAPVAHALHCQEHRCAKDCSTRAAGQGARKGPARRENKKEMWEAGQKQSVTITSIDAEAASRGDENAPLAANGNSPSAANG